MRGLLKRDDPTVQGSVSSKYQLLLGSCLTAHASGASPSLGELPLRVHHVVRNGLTSTSTSMWCLSITACAEAFICWEQAALILFFAAARILGRPCLHPLHASPGLSSGCLVGRRVVSTHQTAGGRNRRKRLSSFTQCVVFLLVMTPSVQDAAFDSLAELSYDLSMFATLLAAHSRSDLALSHNMWRSSGEAFEYLARRNSNPCSWLESLRGSTSGR